MPKKISNRRLHPREESSYRNMISRCYNLKATGYNWYGGRGIIVCDRWLESFENFLEDMGQRLEGHTLDRIDGDGNYEPSNCRWATWKEQGFRKSNSYMIEYLGSTKSLQQWAEEYDIKPNTLLYRLRRGWAIDRALTDNEKALAKERRTGDIDDEF